MRPIQFISLVFIIATWGVINLAVTTINAHAIRDEIMEMRR
jgi:hypothetical protein